MIGLDEKGQMVKRYLPAQDTVEVGAAIDGVKDETLSMLVQNENKKRNSWELTTLFLGVSIFGQVGNSMVGANASSFIEFTFEKI